MLIDRQDVLYAIRSARRTPLLTFVVVLALSVGIGLNAGVFAILNFLFLNPPTKKDPGSFVQIYPRYQGWSTGPATDSSFNAEDYEAIQAEARSLANVAAWQAIATTLDDVRRPGGESILVTCNYFRVFGFDRPLMGRFFNPDECTPGTAMQIAVLSEHFWRNYYSSDPLIIGKVIQLNHQLLTVVGIASDQSANMVSGGVWIPYSLQPAFNHGNSAFQDPNWAWLTVAGRLRRGYSRTGAAAELQTIIRRRDRSYFEQKVFTLDRKTSLVLTDGSFIRNPAMQSVAMILMALILGPLALVLLLACTNVTMLFLSRSITRRGEIAIRLALGAGRARLIRMLALESFFTAAAAGVASIYLAARFPFLLFSAIDPAQATVASAIRPDWKVFGYLAALVFIATVASALAPMRESFRFDLITALKGREGSATMRSHTTSALIVVQLAMSFVLLAAAVLFARLPFLIVNTDPGFEVRHTMTVPLEVEIPPYTEASALAFERSLGSRILDGPRLYTLRNEQALDAQLFVRLSGSASPVAASIKQIVKSLDATQEGTPSTIWDFLASSASDMRSLAKIILFMAGIAIVLAITGVYSVLTFAISQRTREFGIQMTLGATRQSIFRSVMKRGLRQIAFGVFLGLAMAMPAAWAWMRLAKNSWMPIDSFDPSLYSIAALILLVVSLSAMCVPALRATQVDPIQALRNE